MATAATPTLTIQDFLTLGPAPAVPHAEPGVWAIVGLPTNFYADAATHTRRGLLFGQPVTAEFTPVGFQWNYGDGHSIRTTGSGASWRALNLGEFEQTPAGHVYSARGSYTATVTTYYSVRAAFGDDPQMWPVPGTLPIPSAPITVTVYNAKTVLVSEDCTQNPGGPGC